MKATYLYAITAASLTFIGMQVAISTEAQSAPAGTFTPQVETEISAVESEIDRIYAEALAQSRLGRPDGYHKTILLGKLLFYDRQLSVNRNESCAFCHLPEAGFSGSISALNQTTVAYPGSVRSRFNGRKPQAHTYASYAPVLHFNDNQGDFVGGQFWDMRSTGLRLNSALAEQAQEPPVDPAEMALIDPACMVYRVSLGPYRALARDVWGLQAFAIRWPANVNEICDRPGPSRHDNLLPLRLSGSDRAVAQSTFDRIAEAIAAYEGSPEVNPFSAKFDFVLVGKAAFTPDEKAGYELFQAANCNQCHRDGGPGEEPLFTDFTASNLGIPRNPNLPFLRENRPDQFGYTANPQGEAWVDPGVGGFLAGSLNPNRDWVARAEAYYGRYKTPTLRNVDKRPRPDFVKAYMHNGYLKSLKEVVHFYNTRDTLPTCRIGDHAEKTTCWPPAEYPRTMNRTQLGNLNLTERQEEQLVSFLKTLTDGYTPGRQ
jgi:cytochrome c peroxidase